jgi:hypothetical protein
MPSGWTAKQCLGSVITDGSANIRAFNQKGSQFRLATPVLDVTGSSNLGNTTTTFSLPSTPNGIAVEAIFNATFWNGSAQASVYIRSLTEADQAPAQSAVPGSQIQDSTANGIGGSAEMRIWTNTTQQFAARATSAGNNLHCSTMGWNDPRRRLF